MVIFSSPFGLEFIKLVLSPKVISFFLLKVWWILLSHFYTVEAWSVVTTLWKLFRCLPPTSSQITGASFFEVKIFPGLLWVQELILCHSGRFFSLACGDIEGGAWAGKERLEFESHFFNHCCLIWGSIPNFLLNLVFLTYKMGQHLSVHSEGWCLYMK